MLCALLDNSSCESKLELVSERALNKNSNLTTKVVTWQLKLWIKAHSTDTARRTHARTLHETPLKCFHARHGRHWNGHGSRRKNFVKTFTLELGRSIATLPQSMSTTFICPNFAPSNMTLIPSYITLKTMRRWTRSSNVIPAYTMHRP